MIKKKKINRWRKNELSEGKGKLLEEESDGGKEKGLEKERNCR